MYYICLEFLFFEERIINDGIILCIFRKVYDIILNLSTCFDVISFSHVFRELNMVAHALAHLTPFEYSTRIWVRGCPGIVEDIVDDNVCFNEINN